MTRAMVVLVSISTWACSSEPADLGQDKTGELLSDYAASWDGYAEAHEFDFGSDRIRIVLDAAGQGTVEFGDGPALPPATDPDAAYPPGFSPLGIYPPRNVAELSAGFSYPVHDSAIDNRRIRFHVAENELYDEWCGLQAPRATAGVTSGFACRSWDSENASYGACPDASGALRCCYVDSAMAVLAEVDCIREALCMAPICECSATSCEAHLGADGRHHFFDVALEDQGSELVGTLLLDREGGPQRINVRLTRQ